MPKRIKPNCGQKNPTFDQQFYCLHCKWSQVNARCNKKRNLKLKTKQPTQTGKWEQLSCVQSPDPISLPTIILRDDEAIKVHRNEILIFFYHFYSFFCSGTPFRNNLKLVACIEWLRERRVLVRNYLNNRQKIRTSQIQTSDTHTQTHRQKYRATTANEKFKP